MKPYPIFVILFGMVCGLNIWEMDALWLDENCPNCSAAECAHCDVCVTCTHQNNPPYQWTSSQCEWVKTCQTGMCAQHNAECTKCIKENRCFECDQWRESMKAKGFTGEPVKTLGGVLNFLTSEELAEEVAKCPELPEAITWATTTEATTTTEAMQPTEIDKCQTPQCTHDCEHCKICLTDSCEDYDKQGCRFCNPIEGVCNTCFNDCQGCPQWPDVKKSDASIAAAASLPLAFVLAYIF